MKYECVLLDADMTLFDFDAAEQRALRNLFSGMGLVCSDEICAAYHEINKELWARFERGEIEKKTIGETRFTELFARMGVADGGDANARYMEALAEGSDLLPGALDFLRALEGRARLFLVTNGTSRIQYARVEAAGIGRFFENIFVSEDAGSQKPQREYFDYVFASVGEDERSRSVIVGDSLSSDIRGGINAGIDSVWYCPGGEVCPPDVRATFTARSYAEILRFLGADK